MKARVFCSDRLCGRLTPPPSKNYTTRYLLAAALANGESVVHFPAQSDDAEAMVACLRGYGAEINQHHCEQGRHLHIRGFGRTPANPGLVDPANAGAVLRLCMGIGALLPEVRFATAFSESLGKRPHGGLLEALAQLGIDSEADSGRLPIVLRGGPPRGGKVWVSGAESSQFLSALLFLGPLLEDGLEIEVRNGLVSAPLVRTTLEVLRLAGIQVAASRDLFHFRIPGDQRYQAREYWVNGDYPSSAAILAAGVVTNGQLVIERLFEDCQGERAVIELLRRMGAIVEYDGQRVALQGHRGLAGVEFDGDAATDMILAMLGVAAFAHGESRFSGIGNLRLKECDRIAAPVEELGRLGVDCREGPSEIVIRGNPEGYAGGISLATHHDHRMAQLLTIVGLRCRQGVTVLDAQTVAKSYPEFFADLISLGANIVLED